MKARSFRLKVTVWTALVTFGLMFLLLVAFNIHAVHAVAHSAKTRMKTVARSMLEELERQQAPADGPISPETIREIDERLRFIDREGKLMYAIVSTDYDVLYQTPGLDLPKDPGFLATQHNRLFLRDIGSGRDLEDALSEWHFLFRYHDDGFIVFLSDRGDYELLEKVLEGLGVAIAAALALAIPSGFLLSRKVVGPITLIDAAVQEIRAGHLHARIPAVQPDDEISRLIESLNATFAELEDSFDRIRQFSADAAHELQTPLTALRGHFEVALAQERSVAEYQDVLGNAVHQVTLLSTMVRDMLMLADPGRRQSRETFSIGDWAQTVRSTVSLLEPVAAEKHIRITCDCDDAVLLRGDPSLLRRLCYNLIHNAIRFSPSGTAVTVSLRVYDRQAVLVVHDEGVGIAAAEEEKIFERFYQADSSRSTGTGLGLALVKWIVELHGGHIEVESELGQGAEFRVTLPLA